MYSNKFVAAIKVGGKILRERNHHEEVFIPFGSEYSIFMKDLSSRKVIAKIYIDGNYIGHSIAIDPDCSVEIDRFLTDDNYGNRFKFVKKIKEIVDHRGDKIDDGIVKIEFTFEKEKPQKIIQDIVTNYHYNYNYCNHNCLFNCSICHKYLCPYRPRITWAVSSYTYDNSSYRENLNDINCDSIGENSAIFNQTYAVEKGSTENNNCFNVNSDEGVTVPGSISHQKFQSSSIGELEENSYVIIFRLRGYNKNSEIKKPITVNSKLKCSSCGKNSNSSDTYCSRCGTSLTII